MKSSTLLDFAVFQLTPTRTRCDLVISGNGKTEKIASGLLNPFLSHLKTAQEEMAKGGYSIILKPEPNTDATWFTKGTVERFVRFVSTPEVVERVHTLESEILQIEEAIAIQSTCDGGIRSVEDRKGKPAESIADNKPLHDSTEEKAIVLYKPDAPLPEVNGSESQEGNSKVQLLRVLETRRIALQKEQGMAFARAVAAGFEVDNMSALISFAGCFKASRLMDACTRFIELWKRKHESGQWLEIEATEAMSNQSEFFAMNASGIVLSDIANKQKEAWPESHNDIASESKMSSVSTDNKTTNQVPLGNHEYIPGQYANHMFPPWTMHPPPGAPAVFQPYPMQGIPYYQNYQGHNPYFQPAYPSFEDPRLNIGRKFRGKKHSSDIVDNNVELELSDLDEEADEEMNPLQRKKSTKSSKKLPGTVVIRNINYIASKKQNSSDSESHPTSGCERDGEVGIAKGDALDMGKNSRGSSERNGKMRNSSNRLTSSDKEETVHGDEMDGGQWQAFQNYLLRDYDEDRSAADQGMFSMEKEVRVKKRQNVKSNDPLALNGKHLKEFEEGSAIDMQKMSGNLIVRARTSGDDLFSREGQRSDGRNYLDVQTNELGGRLRYRRVDGDDFMIHKRENLSAGSPSDILAENKHISRNANTRSPHNTEDESYIVSLRSTSVDGMGCADRKTIDIDSEIPSTDWRRDDLSNPARINYEPDDMTLMPERIADGSSAAYDIAFDYEMQVQRKDGSADDKNGKVEIPGPMRGSKKHVKDQKLSRDVDRKKNVGPIKRGKPSKLSPLDEARARAERLRSYKADLQKLRKEKEEEQVKRLEALKLERQKRIAARSGSIPAQPLQPSHHARKQVPTKLSPGPKKGSKFSDAEPGSSSPLQRSAIRKPVGQSGESYKTPRTSGPVAGSNSGKNRLSCSVSSLPEQKQSSGLTPETKASMARLRRLSEPKSISSHHASLTKARSSDLTKPKVSVGTDSKKISAIMNLDRSKAATLPELRTRPSKSSDDVKNKVFKEGTDKVNGGKLAASKSVEMEKHENQISQPGDGGDAYAEKLAVCKRIDFQNHHSQSSKQSGGDDNSIVEKTVVVLETEKPAVPLLNNAEDKPYVRRSQNTDEMLDKPMDLPNYTSVYAPDTAGILSGFDWKVRMAEKQISTDELTSCNAEASSNTSDVEQPYQAPYARVSSLEDPCTAKSEYGKALPTGLDFTTTALENVDGHHGLDLKNPKVEKIPEAGEKYLREAPKGIRRLLKFGRKSNSSGSSERIIESDNISVGGSEADGQATIPASSGEANTLKSLISQDETPIAISTPKKSSRHFSLLSPFRSKNTEKKLTTEQTSSFFRRET